MDENYVKGKVLDAGIHAVIELKKEVVTSNVYQTIMETITADLKTNKDIFVFGVLTNLGNEWHIYWLGEGNQIVSTTIEDHVIALEFISRMVEGSKSREFRASNLAIRRIKAWEILNDMPEPDVDVAPMTDFIRELDQDDPERQSYEVRQVIALLKNSPIFSRYFNEFLNLE